MASYPVATGVTVSGEMEGKVKATKHLLSSRSMFSIRYWLSRLRGELPKYCTLVHHFEIRGMVRFHL